jgi:hypothetical protein
MVARFHEGIFVYPGARFLLTPKEQKAEVALQHGRSAAGWVGPVTSPDNDDDSAAEPEAVHEDDAGSDSDLREAA